LWIATEVVDHLLLSAILIHSKVHFVKTVNGHFVCRHTGLYTGIKDGIRLTGLYKGIQDCIQAYKTVYRHTRLYTGILDCIRLTGLYTGIQDCIQAYWTV
jgi:hypothetical protein